MRQTDVTTNHEGFYLFNVNQVAYLVEGSRSQDEKKSTRRRVTENLQSFSHVLTRPPTPGSGVFTYVMTLLFKFGWKSIFDHPDSRRPGWSNNILAGNLFLTTPDSRRPGWSNNILAGNLFLTTPDSRRLGWSNNILTQIKTQTFLVWVLIWAG
jgi:hypothetical protein